MNRLRPFAAIVPRHFGDLRGLCAYGESLYIDN